MKKFVLLFAIAMFVSCNNDDENSERQSSNEEFLLFNEYGLLNNRTYTYNDNNEVIQLNYNNFIYNYQYDSQNNLLSILTERMVNGITEPDAEYIFTSFNETEAHADYTILGNASNVIEGNRRLIVEFDGQLIKLIKYIYPNDTYVQARYQHDTEGKLTLINQENNLINIPPHPAFIPSEQHVINSWDDNEIPSKFSILRHYQLWDIYLFPNKNLSTKNPTRITSSVFNFLQPQNGETANIIYEYDNNGNIISAKEEAWLEADKFLIQYIEAN